MIRDPEMGEFQFIERIGQGALVRPEGVVKGIGDDAAAFYPPAGEIMLLTTDLLIEGVHFLRGPLTGPGLGRKALAVNLSDIAAMGGTAREALVSIAVPEAVPLNYVEEIYTGIKALAGQFAVNILGGDTTGSRRDLMISITVAGSVPETEILRRDAARPGDQILLTGPVGASRAGLHLLLNRIEPSAEGWQPLVDAHLAPRPHLREGRFLAASGAVHAAIDISDGLSADLEHILEQSRVGARILAERLPLPEALASFCRRFRFEPVPFALAGGEDYVLLATAAREKTDALITGFEKTFGRPLFHIGEITASGRAELVHADGSVTPILPAGWDHFRSRPSSGDGPPEG